MEGENEYNVERNIDSLEEIINEVPERCTYLRCFNLGLKSLKGIERLPQVTHLDVSNNQIQSLEFITRSNVTHLYIFNNDIRSLEFITESNVIHLNICNNQLQSLEFITGSNVIELYTSDNRLQSLEFITGSKVEYLNICDNQIQSLEFIAGSNVKTLDIYENPCYDEFNELGESVEKVKEKYDTLNIKEPSEDFEES